MFKPKKPSYCNGIIKPQNKLILTSKPSLGGLGACPQE
ncbi:hypothetical protein HAL013_05420 [Helicobacter ailurogastricus]|uniref:Uncharacterized protein n=1 Tax=Helicobacter ailurogastricus TaxID=1578720 RepID=A0A0K2X2S1_9HELI|nr:hypothetical protein HAL011_07510 [Helicobacter ailurogastricus]CRF42372.1 hypothetical protein HAL013_05420 [Helicobacter ailurogastricus]CRF44627.1 hypothetical protein HAL09_12210 [Helicobacter ailurogastricus]